MSRPPWIAKSTPMFREKPKTSGNYSDAHKKVYTTNRWRNESKEFRIEPPMTCQHPGCIALAEMVDHVIPISIGGSIWDQRNWRKLCNKHHAMKRAKESRGIYEDKIGTKHGYIPKISA